MQGGELKSTKRSYSEFYRLFKKTKESYPKEKLPEFPAKKNVFDSHTRETTQERKRTFDQFLLKVRENKLYTRYLFEFLKTPDELPYFGYETGRESDIYVLSVANPDDPLASLAKSPKSEYGNSLHQTLSFEQPLNMSAAQSLLRESEIARSSSTSGFDLTSTVITNYRGFSANIEKNIKIDIPRTIVKEDENEVYFEIKVGIAGYVDTLLKKYKDFQDLHNQIRDYGKKISVQVPDLPNKGNLGMLTLKTDPKLIEFRKFALKNYLQYLVYDKKFGECLFVKEFLNLAGAIKATDNLREIDV